MHNTDKYETAEDNEPVRHMRHIICFCIGFLFLISNVSSEIFAGSRHVSATIHFRQGNAMVDTNFCGNGDSLLYLVSTLNSLLDPANSKFIRLNSIRVVGAASPEGSVGINDRLSYRRAADIIDCYTGKLDIPDSVETYEFVGRDWTGLRSLVAQDSDVPSKEQVIAAIDKILNKIRQGTPDTEANLRDIQLLNGGEPYRYMYRHLFPQLRKSSVYLDYTLSSDMIEPLDAGLIAISQQSVKPVLTLALQSQQNCKPFYMDVRTNLILDALALPNIGMEFYVGKNFSVGANWMYGWWDRNSSHRYWRAYGGDIFVRRWFGTKAENKPLTGHHLGVYAGIVTYDFEFGGEGIMGGLPSRTLWDRCNFIAGLEYGYSLPVSRRLNIDFTIGVGYLGGKYIKYEPQGDSYYWKSDNRLTWIGPTKAEISLVWLIGCGNYNKSKGGGL